MEKNYTVTSLLQVRLLWITDRPSQASHSKTKFQLNQNVENVNLTNAINMELSETVERTRTTAIDDFVKMLNMFATSS
uniref:Uncharacterized protein n=1 Tax=Glossina palpalis gambiensis TaxID=67801 RepID=A0A1B0B2H1_9MUSC